MKKRKLNSGKISSNSKNKKIVITNWRMDDENACPRWRAGQGASLTDVKWDTYGVCPYIK